MPASELGVIAFKTKILGALSVGNVRKSTIPSLGGLDIPLETIPI